MRSKIRKLRRKHRSKLCSLSKRRLNRTASKESESLRNTKKNRISSPNSKRRRKD